MKSNYFYRKNDGAKRIEFYRAIDEVVDQQISLSNMVVNGEDVAEINKIISDMLVQLEKEVEII